MFRMRTGIITITLFGYILTLATPNANKLGKILMEMYVQERGVAVELKEPLANIKPVAVALAFANRENYSMAWSTLAGISNETGIRILNRGNEYFNQGKDNPYSLAMNEILTETAGKSGKDNESMFG